MFGAQTVVNGDNNGGDLGGEPPANEVVIFAIGAEHGESAAVEEHDDGEIHLGVLGRVEDPEPKVASGVHGYVVRPDAFYRFRVGRNLDVEEVEEAAVNGAVAAACGVGYGSEGPKSETGLQRKWNGRSLGIGFGGHLFHWCVGVLGSREKLLGKMERERVL